MKSCRDMLSLKGTALPDRQTLADPQTLPQRLNRLEKLCGLCRKERRGAAAVEFAVVLPVFVLLIFGMIEFGRVVMVQQLLTNATREGARVGVLSDSTASQVKTRVVDYLGDATVNITNNDVTVVYASDPSLPDSGEAVTVTVSVLFNQVSWLPTPMFLNGKTLTASSTMRRESVN